MAELRLQQLNERDRLYKILDQEYEFTYMGKDNQGLPIEKTDMSIRVEITLSLTQFYFW